MNTAKLILAAISNLRDNGASKEEITQYIENEFSVADKDVSEQINKALENGVAFGAIKKLQGRYYLGDVMEGIREHRRRRRRSGRRRRRRRRRSRHE
ncbi:hypothetical protein Trydic_g4317 [Trypoxylus dichotomus]